MGTAAVPSDVLGKKVGAEEGCEYIICGSVVWCKERGC
jgi:hypothetical protein